MLISNDRQRLLVIRSRLIQARENAGYSQTAVARLLEIHRPTLTLIESGAQRLSVDMLLALCDLYGVEPAGILRKGYNLCPTFDPLTE